MHRQFLVIASIASTAFASACVVIVDDAAESSETRGEETSGDGDGDGDASSSGDGDGDASSSGDGDGDGDSSSSGDGDGDGSGSGSGDGDGDGDGSGDGDCGPSDANLALSYELGGFEDDFEIRDYTWSCTVTAADNAQGLHLELDCPEAAGPVILDVGGDPQLPALALAPGEVLGFRHIYEGPFWFNFYLRLDRELGGHVLTLVDGDSLAPPELFDFELPFPITALDGLCSHSEDFCGARERLALELQVEGQSYEVFDRTHALVGPPPGHEVWVREAGRLHEISCTDTPPDWYRVLIVSAFE